jgi:hypothetical protein
MIEEWRRDGYRKYITDTRPDSEIGESGLYSAQNGLLLSADIHVHFDDFRIGIDPDVSSSTFAILGHILIVVSIV